jgi:hypothetical protein
MGLTLERTPSEENRRRRKRTKHSPAYLKWAKHGLKKKTKQCVMMERWNRDRESNRKREISMRTSSLESLDCSIKLGFLSKGNNKYTTEHFQPQCAFIDAKLEKQCGA